MTARRSATATVLALVLVLASILSIVLWCFADAVGETRRWVEAVAIDPPGRPAGRLLKAALAAGLVRFEPSTATVVVAQCDARYDPALGGADGRPLDDERVRLLGALCDRSDGRFLLDEIEAFNASFNLLAVRDVREAPDLCDDGRAIDERVVRHDCRAAPWSAGVQTADSAFAPVALSRQRRPPQRDYAFLAAQTAGLASDWAVLPPGADDDLYRLATRLSGRAAVEIDLIGRPGRLSADGADVDLAKVEAGTEFRLGTVTGRLRVLCADRCSEPTEPFVTRLTLKGRSDTTSSVVLEARPVHSVPERVRRVLAGDGRAGSFRVARTPHLRLACTAMPAGPHCDLSFEVHGVIRSRAPVRRRLLLADGTPVVDAAGIVTADAFDLGLAPLVGWGAEDDGSIAAALAARPDGTPDDVQLTVDANLQRAARKALVDRMKDLFPTKRPDSPRRASLVLLDAGDGARAGDILAMVDLPELPERRNQWDVEALAAGGDRNNPLAGHAFRAGDVDTMPGSTFKLVTALAGVDAAARGDDRVWSVLAGESTLSDTARAMGINPQGLGELTVAGEGGKSFTVHNASIAHTLAKDSLSVAESKCPPARPGIVDQVGVCEALITSSNLWFAGLSLLTDGSKVVGPDGHESARPTPDLAMAAVLCRLYRLAEPAGCAGGKPLDLLRGALPAAVRLLAEPVRLPAIEANGARRVTLATNAYGQGVTMTPLAVASIYASVATGRVVLPRLLPFAAPDTTVDPNEGLPLFAQEGDGERRRRGLEMIRAGLHGVANVAPGTAHAVFADKGLRARVFSKTGTAETVGKRIYSSWYAGWIEPAAGSGITRRLAFACVVTRTGTYGSTSCGPAIAALLTTLDKQASGS